MVYISTSPISCQTFSPSKDSKARLQFGPILRIHGLHLVGAGLSEGFVQTTGVDLRIQLAFALGSQATEMTTGVIRSRYPGGFFERIL